jgi:hypothetical protein
MIKLRLSRILLGGVLLVLPGLAGCAADWWTVDQSPYEPPSQIADEIGKFQTRAPMGESYGPGLQATGSGEDAGDPAFQPHPAR